MKQLLYVCLALSLCVVTVPASGQIGGLIGKVKKGKKAKEGDTGTGETKTEAPTERKIDKSPAREELLKLDDLLFKQDKYYGSGSITPEYIEECTGLLEAAKQKDPDWDFTRLQERYDERKAINDKKVRDKRKGEIADSLGFHYSIQGDLEATDSYGAHRAYKFKRFKFIIDPEEYSIMLRLLGEADASYPEMKEGETYKRCRKFVDTGFDEWLSTGLFPYLESEIKLARDQFKKDPRKGLETMEEVTLFKNSIAQMKGESEIFRSFNATYTSAQKEFDAYMFKYIYTSKFHSENYGELLVSKKQVDISQATQNDFENDVIEIDGPLWGVVYWQRIRETKWGVEYMWIDGKSTHEMTWSDPSGKDTSFMQFPLIPDPDELASRKEKSISDLASMALLRQVLSLSEGEHTLKFGKGSDAWKITILVKDEHKPKLQEIYDKVLAQRVASVRWNKLESGNSDVRTQAKKSLTNKGLTVLRVGATAGGWIYKKSHTGRVLSRHAYARAIIKLKDGTCTIMDFKVHQDKTSSGYSAPTYVEQRDNYKNHFDGNVYNKRVDGAMEGDSKVGIQIDCGNAMK